MLATYASALLILLGSVIVGRALARALGRRETTWIEPAVGFAILAVAGSASILALDSGGATALVLGLLIGASLVYLRLRVLPLDDLRLAAAPVLAAAALASLPLIASGRIGILGVGINNDLAGHLLWAEWLRDQSEPVPVDLANGYPIGPHSLAASLGEALGVTMADAVVGLLIAVAALTALTALALLRELPPVRRTIACALVGLPYMTASTLALGGFKETSMGLILLGFAVALARLEREYPGDAALLVSLGLLAAGAVAVYSYPGLYWLIGAGALLALVAALRAHRRGRLGPALRRSAPVIAVPLLVMAVAGAAEIRRAGAFHDLSGIQATIVTNSKLTAAVSPLEALGAWPDGNFLAGTSGPPLYPLFGALGIAAVVVASSWWLRRERLALPAAVLAAGVIYAGALIEAGLYVQAKALAVPASLVMLTILCALLDRSQAPGPRAREKPGAGGPRPLAVALAGTFVAVAACSSYLALRDAVVAPNEHADELEAIRERTRGEWTLYLTEDRFTDYQLRSTRVGSPFLSAQTIVPARSGKDFVVPSDFDSPAPETLDAFRWVLITRSGQGSEPPPNLRRVLRTDSYELWKRVGPTPLDSRVLNEKGHAGKFLACAAPGPDTIEAVSVGTVANVFERTPVAGLPDGWTPSNEPGAGESVTQTIELPRGRWLLSLQYLSPLRGITVEAAGESFELPPSLDGAVPNRHGPFWRVGAIESDGGPLEVTVRVHDLSPLQRLLGVGRRTMIGAVSAAPDQPHATVPVPAACFRFVDHYLVPAEAIDRAAVQRRRQLAIESLSGRYEPPELQAAERKAER